MVPLSEVLARAALFMQPRTPAADPEGAQPGTSELVVVDASQPDLESLLRRLSEAERRASEAERRASLLDRLVEVEARAAAAEAQAAYLRGRLEAATAEIDDLRRVIAGSQPPQARDQGRYRPRGS